MPSNYITIREWYDEKPAEIMARYKPGEPHMRTVIALFLAVILVWAVAVPVHANNNAGPPPPLTIRFAPSPGHFPEGVSGVRTGAFGFRINELPEPVPPDGYTFIGWFSEGVQLTAPVASVRSMTILAGYAPVVSSSAPNFAVVYDPGPGQLDTPPIQSFTYGSALIDLPVPTLEGYHFAGWQWGEYLITAPHIVKSDMALEAIWQVAPPPLAFRPVSIPANQFVAAFNPFPGTFVGDEVGLRFGRSGADIEELPGAPRRTGYEFAGWRLPGGDILDGPLVISGDINLAASWAPAPGNLQENGELRPYVETRSNPLTSPMSVSLMIFGAVLLLGIAAAGIYRLNKRQAAAEGQYRAYITRTVREMRLLVKNRPR